MPVYQFGGNPNLGAPNIYVGIQPPANRYINGLPTNIIGAVGVGSWGPVNNATVTGNLAQVEQTYGPVTNRSYDIATAAAVWDGMGANNFRFVRVTDGTDKAATVPMYDTATTPVIGMTLTALYTGVVGNTLQAQFVSGQSTSAWNLVISRPGFTPETFVNISGTGATFWQNVVSAINNGQSGIRGPSQLVTATIGTSVTATPNTTAYTLAGGADGASSVTTTIMLGTDGLTRTGMYALRNSLASILLLLDSADNNTWTEMNAFGLQEGMYALGCTAPGTSGISTQSALQTAGVTSYALKMMVGDWCYYNDTVNGVLRMLAPTTYAAGILATLSPQRSSLNKQLMNLIGTQSSLANLVYSGAQIAQIRGAGLDVIANNSPGGAYFSCRTGANTSNNAVINGDNYTRMTNFIAFTIAAGMGYVVGELQTPQQRRDAKTTLDSFLLNLYRQGMIGDVNNPGSQFAFQTILDASNNPESQVALGFEKAQVNVKYLSIITDFLVDLQGGQSVQITPRTQGA